MPGGPSDSVERTNCAKFQEYLGQPAIVENRPGANEAAAPAKTPREVIARVNDAVIKGLRSPEVRDRLTAIGCDVVAGTPEEFGQFMQNEVERWTRVVQRGGMKPD
jgi:tripartite-type tricarboxylate transporter receptor subunit TctC